jgi:hypothetical protein
MTEPVMLEVRERRGPFGRVVRWAFWIFQAVMLLLILGTCAAVTPYLAGPDPEVALGAWMFGAEALGTLWATWPVGSLLLGLLLLLTRGRRRLIPAPPAAGPAPQSLSAGARPAATATGPAPPRPGGSVPRTGREP